MRSFFTCLAAVAALTLGVATTNAQVLLYDYEVLVGPPPNPPGPDGFFGLGATVSQSLSGATLNQNSMRYSVAAAPTFVGARTETVLPAGLNPPYPAINFDLTILTPSDEYNGAGFARMGITYFGHDIDNGLFGLQVQTNGASEVNIDLPFGTHNLTIPLVAIGGDTFAEIFDGDLPTDLDVVSGFQFYINKTGDSGITVYIDNVRAVPEPGSIAAIGAVLGGLALRRRKH